MNVNLKFYRDYKALFSESEWKKELDSVLKMARFNTQIEEKMLEELFNFICNIHKTKDKGFCSVINSLNEYGKYFEATHSAETVKMYSESLECEMYIASNRQMYADVIKNLTD